ncbi:hypothetical protein F511_40090 [Dorcoceras hygrometricum]|uniref:Uncharacterized protein n=1 Tax=Dorcoceras hygrometricum TaxID=472368 RepID=A0A2Z7CEP2_9LAMI|nr:hypothetical protein F511_40090 [Dorcoceras hygrometricum]
MLSIQTGYTPTASKVDNDKQIPHFCSFSVAVRNNQHSLVQQEHQPAVTTSRNKNPVATLRKSKRCRYNDVVTCHQLLEPNFTYSPRLVRVYYQNDDVAPTLSKPVDTSINQQIHKELMLLAPTSGSSAGVFPAGCSSDLLLSCSASAPLFSAAELV